MKVFVLLLCVAAALASPAHPRSSRRPSAYERYTATMKQIAADPDLSKAWESHVLKFVDRSDKQNRPRVDCDFLESPEVPTSVHQLRPGDVKVVGAMGDSLTAGNGALASTILGCLTEYRGRAFSIGGDKDYGGGVTTLPNIVRRFNPGVVGYSVGDGDENSAGAKLNVAVAGAVASDMPAQARALIDKMKTDPAVDWQKDWKVVTLFIGGNDLCAYCEDRPHYTATNYINRIRNALDILHAEMPRTFVNLVEIFDIRPIADLGTGFLCSMVHNSVCDCAHNPTPEEYEELGQLAKDYQRETENLMAGTRYDTREDFTVVLQPFLRDTIPPVLPGTDDADMSYFAPDCFHFSEKGHQYAAKALWNNMLQPVGMKKTEWGISEAFACPTEDLPYFGTAKNPRY